jgi:glucoamylase
MLPEQIWDQTDIPEAFMYLGRPSGSATPLCWAHAEYIKLLRSISDGEVFDRIPIVAARYLDGHGRKDLEVWRLIRQVRTIAVGSTLRIVAPGAFRLLWSQGSNQWRDAESKQSGLGLGYVDLLAQAEGVLRFRFIDPDNNLPADSSYEVEITRT